MQPGSTRTSLTANSDRVFVERLRAVDESRKETYASWYERRERQLRGEEGGSAQSPQSVANVVFAAVTHREPLDRYAIGSEHTAFQLLRLLPVFVRDFLLRKRAFAL